VAEIKDLDFAFLKYIGVTEEGERMLHRFYLPFFEDYQKVLDLGCGLGGFVGLLCEAGKDASGVDSDSRVVQEGRKRGIPIIEGDILDYLRRTREGSLDAIFSAHLVEHLSYQQVLELIQLAHRALRPQGRLLLATPNPRALVSHLELYPLHFGHVAMYHPDLLAFFMNYCGFIQVRVGENPETKTAQVAACSPLRVLETILSLTPVPAGRPDPASATNPRLRHRLGGFFLKGKRKALNRLLEPGLSELTEKMETLRNQLNEAVAQLIEMVKAIDRPFECYTLGDKA
jgi:SAM-dependent methyltransferase